MIEWINELLQRTHQHHGISGYRTFSRDFSHWRQQFIRPTRISSQSALLIFLAIIMLASAFAVIYLKDLNRRLFIRYQDLQQIGQREEANFSKLLLEQSTLTTQARVEQIAVKKLQMDVPTNDAVMILEK